MKFKLDMAKSFCSDEEKTKYEKMGFEFRHTKCSDRKPWYKGSSEAVIEISSLQELMDFMESQGEELIIGKDTITIYNDYLE